MTDAPTPEQLEPLTEKQQAFVREYLLDFNGRQAAIRAGYAEKAAASQASSLLSKPNISYNLQVAKAATSDRYAVTKENVIRELARLAFSNSRDFAIAGPDGAPVQRHWDDITEDQTAAISEITFETTTRKEGDEIVKTTRSKFKHHDKKGALDTLAKHLGVTKEMVELSGAGGGPLLVQNVERRIVRKPD